MDMKGVCYMTANQMIITVSVAVAPPSPLNLLSLSFFLLIYSFIFLQGRAFWLLLCDILMSNTVQGRFLFQKFLLNNPQIMKIAHKNRRLRWPNFLLRFAGRHFAFIFTLCFPYILIFESLNELLKISKCCIWVQFLYFRDHQTKNT